MYLPRLAITEPKFAGEVLELSATKISRSFREVPLMQRIIGTSIMAANGAEWQSQHRILYRAFTPKSVQTLHEKMSTEIEEVRSRL